MTLVLSFASVGQTCDCVLAGCLDQTFSCQADNLSCNEEISGHNVPLFLDVLFMSSDLKKKSSLFIETLMSTCQCTNCPIIRNARVRFFFTINEHQKLFSK